MNELVDSVRGLQHRMVDRLIDGDLRAAEQILRESNLGGPLVLDGLLTPVMYEVGERWASGEINVAEEHLACTTAHRLLDDFAPALVRAPAGSRELVLLAAPRQERHTLGMAMAAEVLRGVGFKAQIIDGGVPHDDLIAFVSARQPQVVGISIGMPFNDDVKQLYQALVERLPSVGILFGGRTAGTLAVELAKDDPLARISSGVSDAVELVDQLLAAKNEHVRPLRRTATGGSARGN